MSDYRKLLKIQGLMLVFSVLFTFLTTYFSSVSNEEFLKINSRFLELLRAEGSISDSRLEFIVMAVIKMGLSRNLSEDEQKEFVSNLGVINKRSDDKLQKYQNDLKNYQLYFTETQNKTARYNFLILVFKVLNLISILIAILIGMRVLFTWEQAQEDQKTLRDA